ncbi:DHH family phosphoesterase [Bacteroidia bacterium]|nr:DHH family phosphoesterase [Bacteroidia bacterium]MDB9881980.1 DHH family phosphoesterase [Bacteroidia bacterium]
MLDTIAHNLQDLKNSSGRIVITTHHKPDGDAMGSSLGLYHYLKAAGIESQVVTPTDYAEFLHWLPGNDTVIVYEEEKVESQKLIAEAEYVFCLDFNALGRINEMGERVADSTAKIVMIDHHQAPQDFDDERFVEIGASSTCELIYRFVNQHLDPAFMNKEMGECIYTGLITDTGSFRFGSTTSSTIRTAADLMDIGVVPATIYNNLFDQNRLERLQLLGYFLANKIELIEDGKVAVAHFTSEELKKYNVITGDTEGFVNYGLGIKGVQLSALIIDRDFLVKMSFRSTDVFPCNEFSAEFFNGGGHKNAAGGASENSLENVLNRFKEAIKSYRQYL